MLTISVDLDAAKASLERMTARLGSRGPLHEAMGAAVADVARTHIAEQKKSPNTGWWGRVARSVKHEFNADEAVVSVPERGAALRFFGGTVTQKPGGPLLTIPTRHVPVSNGTRLAARMLDLAFIPARNKGGDTVGYLVEGVPRQGKDGKTRMVPLHRPAGRLMYVLRRQTTHQPDPTVLPTAAAMLDAAHDAALDFLFVAGGDGLT